MSQTATEFDAMKVVGDLLERLYDDADFTDEDFETLQRWRAARGDAGKGGWDWWAREHGDEMFEIVGDSRDDVIARARCEWPKAEQISIVEACHWDDWYAENDDEGTFAEVRNAETVIFHANDDRLI